MVISTDTLTKTLCKEKNIENERNTETVKLLAENGVLILDCITIKKK